MSSYTVHRLKASNQRVVVLQYPGLDTGSTVLVAPLFPADDLPPLEGVTPRVVVAGADYLVAVQLMAAVQRKDLGPAE